MTSGARDAGSPRFEIGNIVAYQPGCGYELACGSGVYAWAAVIKTDPLVLASESGDMRWESTLHPEHLVVLGDLDLFHLMFPMRRVDR